MFVDLDGLDGLISESELVLQAWLGALAILLLFVLAGEVIDRLRRSPVEKILRNRRRA